ncbi:MAG: AMP-binding protein [Bacteroidetes bacterium]|nr:AMP-binding protein [Bacteroidota bacterium]MBL6943446.1 AMP-binding protein [Bacteroidales bacterium]
MIGNPQYIQILGKYYTVDDLRILCKEKISNSQTQTWEREIYFFLQDWFSSSDCITAKTSGSTGSPKKISLRKEHMIASAVATLAFFDLKEDDNAWLCLPVNYIAGKMMIVRSIVGGLNLLYSEPASLPTINEKITYAAMVPNQVYELLSTTKGIQQLLKIDKLLIGGSDISIELEKRLLNIPYINAWHTYGMTETITHIALRKLTADNKNTRYYPLPGINARKNCDNQLIIDAPDIGVKGLVTNDIINLYNDGSFLIVGRSDNVVVSGGVKLFPEIIERKIVNYISNNFFVGGVPDDKLGEKLTLFVESDSVDSYNIDVLKENLKNDLSKFEIPKEIIYLPKFFRTDTGKIKRKEIIKNYLGEKK